LGNARGAYANSANVIYLSDGFVETASQQDLVAVVLEEIGHSVDAQVNREDTPGDEGELFSALVRGIKVSEPELERIQTEDDNSIVTIGGQTLQIEQAGTTFVNLANPVGITIDTQDNIIVNSDNTFNLLISKIAPNKTLIKQSQYGGFSSIQDFGHFTKITPSGNILQLQNDGDLVSVDPSTLSLSQSFNLKSLSISTNSIFDIATGTTRDFGGLIQPGAAQTTYGDIAGLTRGSQTDIFVSGLSLGTFPFIMRLRIDQNSNSTDARVIVASTGTTAGSVNLPRGIAVGNQGTVLTTLPISVGLNIPQFIDVPVSFNVDFPEGAGAVPQVRLSGQGANFSDGSNYVDIASQGMTTDTAGNFYIVTNSLGSTALNSAGGGTLVVLSPTVNRVLDVQSGSVLSSYRDVVVNSSGTSAFVTSSGGVVRFPVSITTPTTPLKDKLTTPIIRFQNKDKPGTYLFAGQQEAISIRQNNKNFKEEGLAFQVAVSKDDPLMQPFYRFQNTAKGREGTYLFAGEQEAASIRQNNKNFVEEGLAFYAYSAGVGGGTTEFSRFQNKSLPGTYLFTGPSETNSVRNNSGFTLEGSAFAAGG
jgi:hypothetical protein